MNIRILIVAPGRKTLGGITSVVENHILNFNLLNLEYKWIETHRTGTTIQKLFYLFRSLCIYLWNIHDFNIIHIHLSEPTSLRRKRIYFLIAKAFRKRTIIHFHSYNIDSTIRGRFRDKYNLVFRNCDIVIALTKYWENAIIDEWPETNVTVVPNPCVLPHEAAKREYHATKDRKKNILYMGALNKRKGLADLIQAFSLILKKYPEWHLYVCGNGDIQYYMKYAMQFQVQDNIKFMGWVTGEDKISLFANCDIFCLPSYAEGFPMSVIEAASYSKAIITTSVGGITDYFEDGINCMIYSSGDVLALNQNIEELIKTPSKRRKMGGRAYDLVRNNLEGSVVAQKIILVYKSIIEK